MVLLTFGVAQHHSLKGHRAAPALQLLALLALAWLSPPGPCPHHPEPALPLAWHKTECTSVGLVCQLSSGSQFLPPPDLQSSPPQPWEGGGKIRSLSSYWRNAGPLSPGLQGGGVERSLKAAVTVLT